VYTVRWRVISDDGHTTGGVLAFGVGSAGAVTPSLSAGSTGAGPGQYAVRWLFFLGLLVAAGAAVFFLVVFRPAVLEELEGDERARAEARERRAGSLLAAAGFAVALVGAAVLVRLSHAGWDTRFGRVLEIGLGISAAGLVASLASVRFRHVRPVALTAALALLPLPTLSGHALDQGRPALALILDVAHVTAAAVWIGGLAALALSLWLGDGGLRLPLARLFSGLALAAVVLLAGTGAGRALEELDSFSQLWTTGYGRAILVKTGLLVVLVALAARNRLFFLSGPVERLRRGVTVEGVLLVGLVVAIAVLTALPPGRTTAAAARLQAVAPTSLSPTLPPKRALVLAQEVGKLAVALAVEPASLGKLRLTATMLSPDDTGLDDLQLTFRVNGSQGATLEAGVPCGPGCYRAVSSFVGTPTSVTINFAGETAAAVRFSLPPRWGPAGDLIRRASATFRRLRTVSYRESLASSPRHRVTALWKEAAPDKLAYTIPGGPAGILIGTERWDRTSPTAPWTKSSLQLIPAPAPIWPRSPTNVNVLGRPDGGYTISLLDRSLPAWFTIRFDRKLLPRSLEMTAAAHFMHHDYLSFNKPVRIKAPGVSR
jgi:copper transport protein